MKTRTTEMHLRLTPEEKETLTEKAKLARLSREEFCRRILNGAIVKEAPSVDVRQLLWQMRRIGGNLNQLLGDSRTSHGGSEQILVLVYGIGLNTRHDVILAEFVGNIFNI